MENFPRKLPKLSFSFLSAQPPTSYTLLPPFRHFQRLLDHYQLQAELEYERGRIDSESDRPRCETDQETWEMVQTGSGDSWKLEGDARGYGRGGSREVEEVLELKCGNQSDAIVSPYLRNRLFREGSR